MNKLTLCFYGIVILIFIFVLIATCNKLNNSRIETFQNNGNLNYTIVMFMTGGICEEAHNCIETLKKNNLQDKIRVYTLDKQADKCIKNLNIKTKFNDVKLDLSSNFGEKEFYKMMYEKLNAIEDCLKNTNNIVVYTDTDVVFFKSIEPDISKFSNSNQDIMFQCDNSDFNTDCKVFCAGFMFLKPTQNTFNCLKRAKEIMKRDMDNKQARTEKGGADQRALNLAIGELNINVGTLDLKDYANGSRYFKSKNVNSDLNDIYKNYTPIILHNNYIRGSNKKLRFQHNDMWYI
jgi:hypothetical protein